jgi:hypothetical protein
MTFSEDEKDDTEYTIFSSFYIGQPSKYFKNKKSALIDLIFIVLQKYQICFVEGYSNLL